MNIMNNNKEYYMSHCLNLDANYMVEISLGHDVGLPGISTILEVFHMHLKIWQKGKIDISAIFFIEPHGSGLQALGLIKAPGLTFDLMSTESEIIWNSIWHEGSVDCRAVTFPSALLYYCTKGIDDGYDPDRAIFLS